MAVKGVLIILSGGMDSTICMRWAVQRHGPDKVKAITFDYGQKQRIEIERARASTKLLGVEHKVLDASFLGQISQGFSANVDKDIPMPTIQDVLGDPRPKTYVPNRNMILLSIAAAYAETKGIDTIYCGLQVHDQYGYHDTTQRFVDKLNDVLSENRILKIKIYAPFAEKSKTDELRLLRDIDGNLDLTRHTMTCYNPQEYQDYSVKYYRACGKCPSCSERLKAFENVGEKDTIEYV
jgi:7-cyano-7-deazaguanine synthase